MVISKPGSYRLTGDVTVPDGVDGIDITAPFVTLDLNGFAVRGPVTCTGSGISLSCSGGTSGTGINASKRHVTVRNGVVQGFFGNGVQLFSGKVEDVDAFENGGSGITLSDGIVLNCIAGLNTTGIFVTNSEVKGSTANGNHYFGFSLMNSAATSSTAVGNGFVGFTISNISGSPSAAIVSDSGAFFNGNADIVSGLSAGNNGCTNGPC